MSGPFDFGPIVVPSGKRRPRYKKKLPGMGPEIVRKMATSIFLGAAFVLSIVVWSATYKPSLDSGYSGPYVPPIPSVPGVSDYERDIILSRFPEARHHPEAVRAVKNLAILMESER